MPVAIFSLQWRSALRRLYCQLVNKFKVLRPVDYLPLTGKLFRFKRISNVFVYKHLISLKPSQNTGLDGIPAKLLKDAAPRISRGLAFIMNFSMRTENVPDEWKLAGVTPLFKDDDRDDMENYCPITVLPVASKILERTL